MVEQSVPHVDMITPRVSFGWQADANCAGLMPDDMIVPLQGTPKGRIPKGERSLLRDTCGPCPVVESCLAASLLNEEYKGVRGGLGQRERQRLQDLYNSNDGQIPTEIWYAAIDFALEVSDGVTNNFTLNRLLDEVLDTEAIAS